MAQLMLCALAGTTLASIGSRDCGPDCRTKTASDYPNSMIGYDFGPNDCAWITQDYLDKCDPNARRLFMGGGTNPNYPSNPCPVPMDTLGQCHSLEGTKEYPGILELACGPGITIPGFTKACAKTTR